MKWQALHFSRCYSTAGLVKQRNATKKAWEKTLLQNLFRHKSGRYYARAYDRGKEVWRSLRTSHFSVAQAKLTEFLREHRACVADLSGVTFARPCSVGRKRDFLCTFNLRQS
jgi:hypothetical protein